MKVVIIKSWDDFENQISELFNITRSSAVLFRGQSDSEWNLKSTLERYLNCDKISISKYYKLIYNAKSRIEYFTNEKWNIATISDYEKYLKSSTNGIADLDYRDYMVYLRHHGFPSPLLD